MNSDAAPRAVLPMYRPPYESRWELGGFRYVVQFWTMTQWEHARASDRPGTAHRLDDNAGFINVIPDPD
jgi:hypothetical protein